MQSINFPKFEHINIQVIKAITILDIEKDETQNREFDAIHQFSKVQTYQYSSYKIYHHFTHRDEWKSK